jgi:hypothetical protein
MPAQTVIKLRRDTAANWSSADPVLSAGEIAFESDTNKIKVGDGSTLWSLLDYSSSSEAFGNVDGGKADTNYGGITPINGGDSGSF